MSEQSVSRVRLKIVAVLTSLVALWGFAAYVTVHEGVDLVWFATLEQQVAKPTEAVVAALQAERRDTVAAVAGQSGSTALAGPRAATDSAVATMIRTERGRMARLSMQGATSARLADLRAGLDGLAATRARIDAGGLDRVATGDYFTGLIRLTQKVYDTFTVWNNTTVIYQTSTLLGLTQQQETISEEDALVAGALAAGTFTASDRAAFAELVGVQRNLATTTQERLPAPDSTDYARLLAGQAMTGLAADEDRIAAAVPGKPLTVTAAQWRTTTSTAIEAIRTMVLTLADRTVARARGDVIGVLVRLVLAAGLGLVAVVASIRFLVRGLRTMQRQLAALRASALELADVRLPAVVDRLRTGAEVDLARAAPPLPHGSDDIGLVSAAFNRVQETAIRSTVEQAELRRGVRDVFLNLARRSQAIVHRQLKLIDTMERRATTEAELSDLFRIDHLATRMRRNAENLIVLSGSVPGRANRSEVAVVDVVRGALAEIEEYTRVAMGTIEPGALAGRAAGDVIHLLAELMENAVSFSPPNTAVTVSGFREPGGYVIEVTDHGLGMSAADLAEANARIADPPEFRLSATSRLGFYVVGRLAQRHGITVRLADSATGDGTTAQVLVPAVLVRSGLDPAGRPLSGRPRHAITDPLTSVPAPEPEPGGTADRIAAMVDDVLASLSSTFADAVEEKPAAPGPTGRFTPSGLPVRARRPRAGAVPANAAARAPVKAEQAVPAAETTAVPAEPALAHSGARDPAEIRRTMSAYQDGARRGRAQAEHGWIAPPAVGVAGPAAPPAVGVAGPMTPPAVGVAGPTAPPADQQTSAASGGPEGKDGPL